jgi:hypothetical protein
MLIAVENQLILKGIVSLFINGIKVLRRIRVSIFGLNQVGILRKEEYLA